MLLETRQVKAALSAMVVKTDHTDARGIAQLLRMGWFRPVPCKSPPAQEIRAPLVGRKLLQGKLLDVELSIRGIWPVLDWGRAPVRPRRSRRPLGRCCWKALRLKTSVQLAIPSSLLVKKWWRTGVAVATL